MLRSLEDMKCCSAGGLKPVRVSSKRWLVVNLRVPRKAGEGISNFLMEQGSTGIEEAGEDSTWTELKAYFQQDGRENVVRAIRRYLNSLRKIIPEAGPIQIRTASVAQQNWGENWKRFFRPFRVSSRFIVKPPWSRVRRQKNRQLIDIFPGMAFGTGAHASTRLSLCALERNVVKVRGRSVLDVGTGSGILAIAAAKLGAERVLGCDLDPLAVENARENVRLNIVSDVVKIRKGSLGGVPGRFDLVVANIDLKNLRRMRKPLVRRLKGKGILIVSGILERDREDIERQYTEIGVLQRPEVTQEEEWVCLTFRRRC